MIIVNFSTPNYSLGQQRLASSLNGHKKLMLNSYEAITSPTHAQSPYEFKIWSIEAASKYDPIVLWMDSSMYVKGELSKIEKIILEDGYFMEEAGHYCTTWCNDWTRGYFDLPKDSPYIMFSAGLLGLNFDTQIAKDWFSQWKKSAKAGCFAGDWSNHRHDMVCGSIIAQKMGMKYQRGGSHLSYVGPGYSIPEEGSVIHCQGL